MILPFEEHAPRIHPEAYIEESSRVIGQVTIGKDSSVWFYAVIRGDIHYIQIGERTNVQDLCVIHVTHDTHPTVIKDDVTIGHRAVLHGCTIEDRCLVGIGSVILDGASVGPRCLVAANSLVPPGFRSVPGTLIMGSPAKTVRDLTERDLAKIDEGWDHYVRYARRYRGK